MNCSVFRLSPGAEASFRRREDDWGGGVNALDIGNDDLEPKKHRSGRPGYLATGMPPSGASETREIGVG